MVCYCVVASSEVTYHVACCSCDAGYHHICAGMDMQNEPEQWFCPVCKRLENGDSNDGDSNNDGEQARWQDDIYTGAGRGEVEVGYYAPVKKRAKI